MNLDDFKEPKKLDKVKIINEIIKLANDWRNKRNDPALIEQFKECCSKLGSESTQNTEFSLMLLRDCIMERGFSFERVHRFHIRIQFDLDVVDLKINY